jgi:hypothetical protein
MSAQHTSSPGFAIYLEKPSAFTIGLAIAHAVLPKEAFTIRR